MQLVQTPGGPRVALSPAALTLLVLESQHPVVREKARAWLDAYRAFCAAGVPELTARVRAGDAWDNSLTEPDGARLRRLSRIWMGDEDGPPWCRCLDCGVIWQPPRPRGRGKLRARVHEC
jgi:hypothetical protein